VKYSASAEVDQPKPGKALKVVNSVTAKRVVSAYRDAAFVRDLEGLSATAASGSPATTSVIYIPPSNPCPSSIPSYPPRSRYPLWWRNEKGGRGRYAPPAGRAYKTPAQWRDTSPELRVLYAHKALKTLGSTYTLNLNLRPDIEAQALTKTSPAVWLQKRIAKELKAALGRPVSFYIVIEEDHRYWQADDRRWHVHGEFGITADEAPRGREALRRAGGVWDDTRQHQAHTAPAPDEGWPSYVVKDFWRYTPGMMALLKDSRIYRVTLAKPEYASTDDIRRLAPALYEDERRKVYRARYGRA
jgi:hypothetical protein